jgi:UDP-N-acetylmuramoyl-tripeptide--D-alanyl-D-alanine ligase
MENFIEMLYARFLLGDGISTDTRSIKKGNLFFALKGPNFNGSQYAVQALEKGASYVVIDDEAYHVDDPRYILCEDTLGALQDLARFHRSKFKRPVVALTGSNGKTTTKELIAAVLSKKYTISATQGNLNNHIGVPLTVMGIYPQVEIAIVEMGANHVGEIADLCEIARPTHGLITNIGHAHTELFGGIEGVLRGKSELFDFVRKTNGKAFVNQNDDRLQHMTKRFDEPITFPPEDVRMLDEPDVLAVMIGDCRVNTHLFGSYNYQNIAAAVAVGRHFHVPDQLIADAISDYQPDNMRSQMIISGTTKLILDAYNANPDSMSVALENLLIEKEKKIAILGDMFEIESPETQHGEIGSWLASKKEIEAIFIGDRMQFAHKEFEGSQWFASAEAARKSIEDMDLGGYTVLLKASRSMKLETLKEAIIKKP